MNTINKKFIVDNLADERLTLAFRLGGFAGLRREARALSKTGDNTVLGINTDVYCRELYRVLTADAVSEYDVKVVMSCAAIIAALRVATRLTNRRRWTEDDVIALAEEYQDGYMAAYREALLS